MPDWMECLTKVDKAKEEAAEKVEKAPKSEEEIKAEADLKYQDFVLQKLGKLSFATSPNEFTVNHEVQVCGGSVKLPVFHGGRRS